jgi:hypothetical protein
MRVNLSRLYGLLAAGVVAAVPAGAQTGAGAAPAAPAALLPKMKTNEGDLLVVPLAEKRASAPSPDITPQTLGVLIGNGSSLQPTLWPASFVAEGHDACTATLVGPRTLLTAAHCVSNGGRVAIKYAGESNVLKGFCSRVDGWTTSAPTFDVGLCLMDEPVEREYVYYENVSLNAAMLQTGRRLFAGGFGCTEPGGQPRFGKPLTGANFTIQRLPQPGSEIPGWLATEAFRDGSSTPFLCGGDSGGAAYRETGNARYVLAVASALQTGDNFDYGRSYFSALSTPAVRQFIERWAEKHPICGIGTPHTRCRKTTQ